MLYAHSQRGGECSRKAMATLTDSRAFVTERHRSHYTFAFLRRSLLRTNSLWKCKYVNVTNVPLNTMDELSLVWMRKSLEAKQTCEIY